MTSRSKHPEVYAARLWLSRLARRHSRELTRRLGGPARSRAILLLAGVLALNSADTGAIAAIAVQLESGLHIGNAKLGLLVTVSSLVGALATVPVGILTDRTKRVRLLSASIVLWGVAEAVSGFSSSFTMLVLVRLALGAVTASAGPVVASLTGDLFPANDRGRVYGYIITGEFVGAAFGLVVASAVSGWFGWRVGFVILAPPSLLLAWALYAYLPEPARGGQSHLERGASEIVSADQVNDEAAADEPAAKRQAEDDFVRRAVAARRIEPREETVEAAADPAHMSTRQALRYVLMVPTNVSIIIASSLGYFFFSGLRTFAVIYLRGQFGIGQTAAGALALVVAVGAVGGLLVAGRGADRRIRSGHVSARITVGAAGYIMAAALLLPALLSSNLAVALPLLVLAAAAVSAPNPPLNAARLDVVPAQLWGRAEGVRTALRNSLEAFAPLLFGLLSQAFGAGPASFGSSVTTTKAAAASARQAHGLQVTFLLMISLLAAAGVLLLVMRRHYAVDVASAGKAEQQAAEAAGAAKAAT